jgi:hypothetical protein
MIDDRMDDDLPQPPSPLKARLLIALGALAALGLIGGIGQLSGAGWFAHRTILWGEGELYVLNMGMEPVGVVADGGKLVEVAPQDAQLIPLIGGTTRVEVRDKSGTVTQTHEVTIDGSHALLKLGEPRCLAVVDLTPFYGGKGGGQIIIHEVVPADQPVWIAGSRNVVWPRRDLPPRLAGGDGPGRWVEIVGCELLDDRPFLAGMLQLRLEERVKKLRDPAPK